jgi:hypothetical protein
VRYSRTSVRTLDLSSTTRMVFKIFIREAEIEPEGRVGKDK